MSLAYAIKGATYTPQTITWKQENSTPWNLSGGTVTARISTFKDKNGRNCDGTFDFVTDGSDGRFRWDYGTVDVSKAGNFYVQFKCTYAGGEFDLSQVTEFSILPSI